MHLKVSSLKFVYSKQTILGLTQELCWVAACVGGQLSKQLSYVAITIATLEVLVVVYFAKK